MVACVPVFSFFGLFYFLIDNVHTRTLSASDRPSLLGLEDRANTYKNEDPMITDSHFIVPGLLAAAATTKNKRKSHWPCVESLCSRPSDAPFCSIDKGAPSFGRPYATQ